MADIIEDIKSRLDVVTFLSTYIQLKKTGRNYKGICPFHGEKTPSFVVSPEKQIWHCFGCGKGGDIFAFIREIESVEFPEAIQILADKAGIKIENVNKFQKKEGKSEKDAYHEAHEFACDFFEQQLHDTKDGEKVLKYLQKRGLTDDTIKDFRLGFAPDDYEALYPYLLKKGVKRDVIVRSGFASSKGIGDDKIFDKYRARLMIPILDYMGKICGFGGRALKEDQNPKYLNSPDNIIYNKSKLLYGLSQAKKFVKENDQIILVEGYFDMILPFQAGVKNIVATSGTALTQDHVRIIKRLTNNVVTSFDTDSAGFEATKRAYFMLQNEDMNVKTVWQLDKKDPADYVVDHGEKFLDVIKAAKDFVSFYIEKLVAANDVTKMDGRRNVLKEILPIFKNIPATSRDFYVRQFSNLTNINETSIRDDIDKFNLPYDHPARETAVSGNADIVSKIEVEDMILAILLEYQDAFEKAIVLLKDTDFSEEAKNVYNELLDQYNSTRSKPCKWNFDKGSLSKVREKINVLTLYAEDKYGEFSPNAVTVELEKLVDKLRRDCKTRKLKEIENGIKEAEDTGDKDKLLKLLMEQQSLLTK